MIELKAPPYKARNGWLTAVLFIERWTQIPEDHRGYKPLFSLNGREGFIDCRKTFVEIGDPTGYRWAMQYLDSWEHWEKLMTADWFAVEVSQWRSELQAKMKSDALAGIKEIASEAGPQRYLALKYVAAQEYDKPAHGRGRPSKEEMKGALKEHVQALSREQEDAQRMGLDLGKPN